MPPQGSSFLRFGSGKLDTFFCLGGGVHIVNTYHIPPALTSHVSEFLRLFFNLFLELVSWSQQKKMCLRSKKTVQSTLDYGLQNLHMCSYSGKKIE
jgi:hypothetical protein